MYKNIQKQLSTLKEPTAFGHKTFDELLNENIQLAHEILGENWKPLEADPYMKKLRVMTLRQLHNQADKLETVKQLLLTTATGADLDHLGSSKNIFRDIGEYPYANFEFSLVVENEQDTIIPAGIILNDKDDEFQARLKENILIKAGDLKAVGIVELLTYTEKSKIKTENLVTDLTFGIDIKQLEYFENGAVPESDERYRLRIIASNDRYATAGSKEAYKYFVYSADARIDDVSIPDDNEPLEVNIFIASFKGVDNEMIKRVYKILNKEYNRPLGDLVTVKEATPITLDLRADIYLFDILKQKEIDKKIKENFKNSFYIGQDFILSDFMRKSHIEGVYKVDTPFNDVMVSQKEIIKINSISFRYLEAEL